MSRVKLIEFSSYGLQREIAKTLERIWAMETNGKLEARNFARLAKDANNNIRDAINALELELMAAEPIADAAMPVVSDAKQLLW